MCSARSCRCTAASGSASGVDSTVVLTVGCGTVLQYPAALEVKLVEEQYGPCKSDLPKQKKKRAKKRSGALNAGEECQREYHLKVRDRLLRCYTGIRDAAISLGYFPVQQPSHTTPSTCTGNIMFKYHFIVHFKRKCVVAMIFFVYLGVIGHYRTLIFTVLTPMSDVDFAAMSHLASLTDQLQPPFFLKNDIGHRDCGDVFGRIVSNICDQDLNLTVMGRQFCVPRGSAFLLSDLSKINPLYDYAATAGLYDVIVMDPPWENRSAIRGKKYAWLPSERLLDVCLPRLAADGAIVAVWVTNKRKLAMFVQDTLFPRWHVHYLSEWHWLKVTAAGDLIHDMDSVHKKPYEIVVIGRYSGPGKEVIQSNSPVYSTTHHNTLPPAKRPCSRGAIAGYITNAEHTTNELDSSCTTGRGSTEEKTAEHAHETVSGSREQTATEYTHCSDRELVSCSCKCTSSSSGANTYTCAGRATDTISATLHSTSKEQSATLHSTSKEQSATLHSTSEEQSATLHSTSEEQSATLHSTSEEQSATLHNDSEEQSAMVHSDYCVGNATECYVKNQCQEASQPFTFICVASQTHSQKPYLGDILTKHVKKNNRQLELFARNLLPNCTSWGNEVLKFQQVEDHQSSPAQP